MKNKYVIVRTFSTGCFAGYLDEEHSTDFKKIVLEARRLWYWAGAASLSQLAQEGTKQPAECKFPIAVTKIELISSQGFEILDVTPAAQASIEGVPVWSA